MNAAGKKVRWTLRRRSRSIAWIAFACAITSCGSDPTAELRGDPAQALPGHWRTDGTELFFGNRFLWVVTADGEPVCRPYTIANHRPEDGLLELAIGPAGNTVRRLRFSRDLTEFRSAPPGVSRGEERYRRVGDEVSPPLNDSQITALAERLQTELPPEPPIAYGCARELADRRLVLPLVSLIADPSYENRARAAVTLGQIGIDGVGGEALARLAEDPQAETQDRIPAALALGRSRTLAPLRRMIESGDAVDQSIAAFGLATADDFRWKTLLRTLEADDDQLRQSAIVALARSKDRRALDVLLPLLESEDWGLRLTATRALGTLGQTEAAPHLLESLRRTLAQDILSEVAPLIVQSIGLLGSETAIEGLLDVLRTPTNPKTEAALIDALARTGDPRVPPVLFDRILHDQGSRCCVAEYRALVDLRRSSPRLAGQVDFRRRLDDPGLRKRVRKRIEYALHRLGDPGSSSEP